MTANADATSVGAVSINFFVATTKVTASNTYKGKVLAVNPTTTASTFHEINICTGTAKKWDNAGDYTPKVENVVIGFTTVKGAQGSFNVKWGVTETLWSFSYFTINFGFLKTGTATNAKNLRCNAYK